MEIVRLSHVQMSVLVSRNLRHFGKTKFRMYNRCRVNSKSTYMAIVMQGLDFCVSFKSGIA